MGWPDGYLYSKLRCLHVGMTKIYRGVATAEPEVSIAFFEAAGDELLDGLREGRYDVGMSLQGASDPALETQPLWIEHMAVAIPLRFPLLEQASLTIADLQNYPIFRWRDEACSSLDRRLLSLQAADQQNLQYVTSFEMMALWVSAGYGVDFHLEVTH